MSPKDFLRRLECGWESFDGEGGEIVVEGDLVIKENDDLLEVSAAAKVRGRVAIERCVSLTSFSLHVDGDLFLCDLPNLRSLRGLAGRTQLTRCGMKVIGADFETVEGLNVLECQNLSKINCLVGGTLIVDGCPDLQMGPAFSCETALVDGCIVWGCDPKLPARSGRGGGIR
jgi:hypothetical protein